MRINTSPKPQHPGDTLCFSTSPNLSGPSLSAYRRWITCKAYTVFRKSVVTVLRRDSSQGPGLWIHSGRTVHPTAYPVLTAINISDPCKPDGTTKYILRGVVSSNDSDPKVRGRSSFSGAELNKLRYQPPLLQVSFQVGVAVVLSLAIHGCGQENQGLSFL